jgi:outer membrane receptor protein involved in Fe transport
MNSNPKLSYAIAAILGGTPVSILQAATATDTSDEGIAEITVTAQRRDESIQNVPITIQAITGDTLKQLNVSSFEDLLRFTPNVTYSGNGPGTGNIFIRGLSSGGSGNQSQSTTAPFPNVALYLDDQSMQFPARNNDVYFVDMERVEILEGPQGTLFGGGAEAGAVRYITNKPKLDVTEGNVNASYGVTAGGDPNSSVNATINLPLIEDTLAVRGVIFDDRRGGYINNVPGTICSSVEPTSCATNGALVGNATNSQTYQGFRLSGLYKFNDDWNLLIQQNYQNMEADGYWGEYPNGVDVKQPGSAGCPAATNPYGCLGTPLPSYSIQAFTPAFDKDKYESTAWTLNGKVGILKAVYTGSYMIRHIDQQADYSNYLTTGSGSLYDCTGTGAGFFKTNKPTNCAPPVGSWEDKVRNTHQSHEIRVSTPDDWRLRGLFGAYWEKFDIQDNMNFNYLPVPLCSAANLAIANSGGADCISAVGPVAGFPASDPSLRDSQQTAFGEDADRGYRQAAFFTSIDFDLIPKVLTVTGGTRYFHYDDYEVGSEYYTESHYLRSTAAKPTAYPYGIVVDQPNGACTAAGGCGFGINLGQTESGFRSRGNITWHIVSDIMVYYTFSQGFRPGGFNRTGDTNGIALGAAEIPILVNGVAYKQYRKPVGFGSDNLINNEIGFKGEFLDRRLQVNASAYLMHWQNIQLSLFSPPDFGNTTFNVNGPSYDVRGFELQLIGRVTDGLTIQGSASWNSSKQTNSPCLESVGSTGVNGVAGNPTPAGQCITTIDVHGVNTTLANAFGALGTSPAFSPPLEFNLRARYDWAVADYKPFASVGANHIGAERNEPASFTPGDTQPIPTTTLLLYTMPSYTTYDAAIGVAKDNWTVTVSGTNLSNSDASTNTSSGQFIKTEFPLRPRVLTAGFGYKF